MALIPTFRSPFNKEFKDSFPSTDLNALADCYEKNLAGLISEICIDELALNVGSDAVAPSQYQSAKFDLHKDEDRRIFYSSKD